MQIQLLKEKVAAANKMVAERVHAKRHMKSPELFNMDVDAKIDGFMLLITLEVGSYENDKLAKKKIKKIKAKIRASAKDYSYQQNNISMANEKLKKLVAAAIGRLQMFTTFSNEDPTSLLDEEFEKVKKIIEQSIKNGNEWKTYLVYLCCSSFLEKIILTINCKDFPNVPARFLLI